MKEIWERDPEAWKAIQAADQSSWTPLEPDAQGVARGLNPVNPKRKIRESIEHPPRWETRLREGFARMFGGWDRGTE